MKKMKFGFIIPGGDIKTILDLASEAEAAGWDGVFYWDGIYIEQVPLIYDAWTVLAAMALRTKRIRLGALLTAVARRRPWKLAREATTVDHLSNGRLIIPVGLGALDDGGYTKVGEQLDRRVRAELLDESLEILEGLWTGKPFSYQGKHYKLGTMVFQPSPIQKPRIPIWVVVAWPKKKSMDRVLRYDGVIPAKMSTHGGFEEITPSDIIAIREFVRRRRRQRGPFDIVMEGQTPLGNRKKGGEIVDRWREAGVTWWVESRWSKTEEVRPRIRQGPPVLQ